MKWLKIFGICIFCLIGMLAFGGARVYLDHWTFMTPDQAQTRWGKNKFSIETFKSGSVKERASEAADLVRNQTLVGKSADEIVELLGPTSGYFWSDRFPTYFVEEGWSQKKDSWQLVFLLNSEDRVTEVRIHKNCCYSALPWDFSEN